MSPKTSTEEKFPLRPLASRHAPYLPLISKKFSLNWFLFLFYFQLFCRVSCPPSLMKYESVWGRKIVPNELKFHSLTWVASTSLVSICQIGWQIKDYLDAYMCFIIQVSSLMCLVVHRSRRLLNWIRHILVINCLYALLLCSIYPRSLYLSWYKLKRCWHMACHNLVHLVHCYTDDKCFVWNLRK